MLPDASGANLLTLAIRGVDRGLIAAIMEYNASGPDRSIRLRMSQQRMSMAADSGASGQNFTKQEVSWAGSLSVKPFRQLFEISQSQAAMNSAQTTLPAKHCDRPLRRAVQHARPAGGTGACASHRSGRTRGLALIANEKPRQTKCRGFFRCEAMRGRAERMSCREMRSVALRRVRLHSRSRGRFVSFLPGVAVQSLPST